MKLQIDSTLTDIVRKPRTHRIPENILLQICLYFAVFFLMQCAEMLFLMPVIYNSYMDMMSELMQKQENIPFREFMSRLNNIMMEPHNFKMMLLSTGFGTIVVLLWCRLVEGRKLRTLGFVKKHALVQYLVGMAVGMLVFSAVVGLSVLLGGLQFEGFEGKFTGGLLLVFIGYLIQGMSEEVLCRGYMMTSTLRNHNFWWAVGINSVLFGVMHVGNRGFSVLAMLNLVLCGIQLSLYVLRTGNLWGACAFHSIWNFAQGNFYGLPVSGMNSGDSVFRMSLKGSSIVNGGSFGIEASIATTIVLSLVIVILLFVPNPFAKKTGASKPETEAV